MNTLSKPPNSISKPFTMEKLALCLKDLNLLAIAICFQ